MTEKEDLKPRRLRRVDFVAESLHEIANHSSSPGAEELHKAADSVAKSTDQTMITILEEPKPVRKAGR
jgi:hypothetical protein